MEPVGVRMGKGWEGGGEATSWRPSAWNAGSRGAEEGKLRRCVRDGVGGGRCEEGGGHNASSEWHAFEWK